MDFDFAPVEDLTKVPDQFRPLYSDQAGEDGKFALAEAFGPTADVVKGLAKNLRDMRAGLKDKRIDLTPLAEYGSNPQEIKDRVAVLLEEAATAKPGDIQKQLESAKASITAAHAKELEKANKRGEALQGQLYSLLVENAATAAVAEAKGVPELLLPFIKNQVKVAEQDGEFKVFVVDPSGDPRYGATGSPMTIKELVAEMKAQEKFGRLFESEAGGGGGGTPPGSGRRPAPQQREGEPRSSIDKIAAGLRKRAGGR